MRKSAKTRGMVRPLGGCILGAGREGTNGKTKFIRNKQAGKIQKSLPSISISSISSRVSFIITSSDQVLFTDWNTFDF
jgi:hypothetical protein